MKSLNCNYEIPNSQTVSKKGSDFYSSLDTFVKDHSDLELHDIVRIDPGNIEADLYLQPETIATISILFADAENKYIKAKQQASECYAELFKNYKEDLSDGTKKPTVADINNSVIIDESYRGFIEVQHKFALLVETLKGIKSAVECKSRIVRDIYNGDKLRSELIEKEITN